MHHQTCHINTNRTHETWKALKRSTKRVACIKVRLFFSFFRIFKGTNCLVNWILCICVFSLHRSLNCMLKALGFCRRNKKPCRFYRMASNPTYSRDSDELRVGRPGFNSQQCKIFLLSTASRSTLGPTQPPIQWVSRALSAGVKRQGREADNSPPSNAKAKKSGAISPLLHMSSWHST
jgi:hypothetical protein